MQDEETILADSERAINAYHDPSPRAMRKVVLAPCSPFSVSERLMRESARLARRHGVRLHTHLAETADEDEYCLSKYGVRPGGAHGALRVHRPGRVLRARHLLQRRRACHAARPRRPHRALPVLQHAPWHRGSAASATCWTSGSRSRWPWTARRPTTPPTSSARCATRSSCRGCGRAAARWARAMCCGWPPSPGAAVLGFEGVGKLEEGCAADLAVFDIGKMEYCGSLSDPFAALLFAGYNHGTAYTICNGRVVVDNGRLTGVDEEQLIREANRISAKLTQSA